MILGKRGSGKTTLIKERIENTDKPCVIIVDVNNEYDEYDTVTIDDLMNYSYGVKRVVLIPDDIELFIDVINEYENALIIIDEFDLYSQYLDNYSKWREVTILSRQKGIDFIIASKRPYRLSKLITAQLDRLTTFKLIEKRDNDYLKDTVSDDFMKESKKLSQYEYLTYSF